VVTDTQIPKPLWDEIAKTMNYIQNRCPTRALKLMTLEEAFTGIRPHLGHLQVIRCLSHYHIPNNKRNKFDPKAIPSILLGYDEYSKAYHCYNAATRQILVSRDVRFDETIFKIPHPETTEPLEDPSFLSPLLSSTLPTLVTPPTPPPNNTIAHPNSTNIPEPPSPNSSPAPPLPGYN